ncbi:MAG: hypothetical protein OXI41_07475 [Chloroflexota bacterium]|nr:hypothetical protein [Chloroflexota bacterium]MDE2895901.1 hypothetical protein [Chloroflexota bacterium]
MSTSVVWPRQVVGARATIRRFEHTAANAEWMEEAAQAIAGRAAPCRLQDRLDDGDQGWWIIGDQEIVGALSGKLVPQAGQAESQVLIWTWLAIDARWRAYGYGGASVPLLEQAASETGATLALTPLPPDNGVALYFWLRLGYTPLRSPPLDREDWPAGVASDALWMQRPLDSLSSTDTHNHEE